MVERHARCDGDRLPPHCGYAVHDPGGVAPPLMASPCAQAAQGAAAREELAQRLKEADARGLAAAEAADAMRAEVESLQV